MKWRIVRKEVRGNRRKDGCFSRIDTTTVSVHEMQQYRPYELLVCVFIYEYTHIPCSLWTSVAGGLGIPMITAPLPVQDASGFLPTDVSAAPEQPVS